jgi:hypothetical protein
MGQTVLFIGFIFPMLFSILPVMGLLPSRPTGRPAHSPYEAKIRLV